MIEEHWLTIYVLIFSCFCCCCCFIFLVFFFFSFWLVHEIKEKVLTQQVVCKTVLFQERASKDFFKKNNLFIYLLLSEQRDFFFKVERTTMATFWKPGLVCQVSAQSKFL